MTKKQGLLGIEFDKQKQTNEWYSDIIKKSDLIDYTAVSGCYVLRPKAQFMWDTIRQFMDKLLAKRGIRNASFPLLIPESYLLKEQKHVEGFAPEVAWVTETGNTKLKERLAIRPTSEAIMYPTYAKWVRSHKDLPILINQWCSVVRWEFKNPMPFLRSREFYWQEGHTVHATKAAAEAEVKDILINVYQKTYEEILAIPCLVGRKTDKEKFAGADYSLSCEVFLPIGKAIQGCTSHHLGQNFSKVFDIAFVDEKQQKQYAWQNSWGFTTRAIGVAIMMHSDNKGLIIPPRVAERKVVIIPILQKGDNKALLAYAHDVEKQLKKFNPYFDVRDDYSVGWKYNDAELKGYPLRLEIGKQEVEKKVVTVVRRDTSKKETIPITIVVDAVSQSLEDMHHALFDKAKDFLVKNIFTVDDKEKICSLVREGRIVKTYFDGEASTDERIKNETGGKTLIIPFDENVPKRAVCPFTGNPARQVVYVARSL